MKNHNPIFHEDNELESTLLKMEGQFLEQLRENTESEKLERRQRNRAVVFRLTVGLAAALVILTVLHRMIGTSVPHDSSLHRRLAAVLEKNEQLKREAVIIMEAGKERDAELEKQKAELNTLLAQQKELLAEKQELARDFASYKEEYKKAIRARAQGIRLDNFVLGSKELKDVVVSKWEPDGLRLVHSGGSANVPFYELPDSIQRMFGYEPNTGNGGVYSKAMDSGALVWNEYPSTNRKIEWQGSKDADGFAQGRGVVLFSDREQLSAAFMGTMHRGKMEGTVVAVYPRAAISYFGQIKNWSEHGAGRMTFSDGSIYQGEWKDGNRHGMGTQWNTDGAVQYEGEFRNDRAVDHTSPLKRSDLTFRPSLRGMKKRYRSSDLTWYGYLNADGLASGTGVTVSRDNKGRIAGVYHGIADKGLMDSEVVAIYAKARQAYIGSLQDWNEEGSGQMLYSDGTSYRGEWKRTQRHGFGTMLSASGSISERGTFVDDKLVRSALVEKQENGKNPTLDIRPTGNGYAEWQLEEDFDSYDHTRETEEAWTNIAGILAFQNIYDWALGSDDSHEAAVLSQFLKYNSVAPGIDNNLKVIFPDAPDPVIHFMRNVMCAIVDGTISLEDVSDLKELALKNQVIEAAQREGASEGQAVKMAALLLDMGKKVGRVQDNG